jgi:transcriptional regulator with XRE-family HTH domain
MRTFDRNKIKERRQELRLSQEKLAQIAGLTREHLVELEKGRSIPKVDMLAKLARALNVSESYFFVEDKAVI